MSPPGFAMRNLSIFAGLNGDSREGSLDYTQQTPPPPLLLRLLSKENTMLPSPRTGPWQDTRAGPPPGFHKELARPFQ